MDVRLLDGLQEIEAAAALVAAIWGETLITVGELRAFEHAGNPVLGAFEGGRLIGTSIAFVGLCDGLHLHSHITGVAPGREHAGVGYALKLAQRDWCLKHRVPLVVWTFDPLVSRNAYFNFRKLGATAHELLVNFYGRMTDEINRGDASDRLLVRWDVGSERVRRAVAGEAPFTDEPAREVEVPLDYPDLRRTDLHAAQTVRLRTREELASAFADGLEVVDFTRDGRYVLAPRPR
jgi:Uncharacterized conserved protein